MHWLAEIFESTSDQARLVTTIIAAIIAISVVLLNQKFNSDRARKDKLIAKIEEIYSALIKMQLLKASIHSEIVSGYPKRGALPTSYLKENNIVVERQAKLDGMHNEFLAMISQAYMLAGLYFPLIQKQIKDIWDCYDELYVGFVQSEQLTDYINVAGPRLKKIDLMFANVITDLTSVMKVTMH